MAVTSAAGGGRVKDTGPLGRVWWNQSGWGRHGTWWGRCPPESLLPFSTPVSPFPLDSIPVFDKFIYYFPSSHLLTFLSLFSLTNSLISDCSSVLLGVLLEDTQLPGSARGLFIFEHARLKIIRSSSLGVVLENTHACVGVRASKLETEFFEEWVITTGLPIKWWDTVPV